MSVRVCVILCYQPSPNTPPQTYISHFGMMALPVLVFLIMMFKMCCRPLCNVFAPVLLFSFFLCYLTPPITSPLFYIFDLSTPHLSISLSSFLRPFIPHITCRFLPRSVWGLHSSRQCLVRWPQRHPERKMLRRFSTATASSQWDARYMSSTMLRLSSSGFIRSVSAPAAPPTCSASGTVCAQCISAAAANAGSLLLASTSVVPPLSLTSCSTH